MKLQRVRINRSTAAKPALTSSNSVAVRVSAPSGTTVLGAMRSAAMMHSTAQPLRQSMVARYAAVAGNKATQGMLQRDDTGSDSTLEQEVEDILAFLRNRRQPSP